MTCSYIFPIFFSSDNIFIFHLTEKCFWQLPDSKVHKCSAIKFIPRQNNNLLIGSKSGFIYEIEISEYIFKLLSRAVIYDVRLSFHFAGIMGMNSKALSFPLKLLWGFINF